MTAEESVITKELQALVGVEALKGSIEVEKGHIRRFAEAIEDPNPLYQDAEKAKRSRYGTIIAPPIFLIDSGLIKMGDILMSTKCSLKGLLNGGTEVEYFNPMRVGDTIYYSTKLAELKEKTGQSGKLLFMIVEVTYTNQKGELVSKCRETFVRH